MASITYFVEARAGSFKFQLKVFDSSRWEIAGATGLGRWEPLLRPPGNWEYRKGILRKGGFLHFFLDDTRARSLVISLDEVPDDYLHGPFCSIASGKGELSPSVKDFIPIVWTVKGPGCT